MVVEVVNIRWCHDAERKAVCFCWLQRPDLGANESSSTNILNQLMAFGRLLQLNLQGTREWIDLKPERVSPTC